MAKVTYRAPAGDSEVVTIGGLRFFDGQALDVGASEHGHLLGKLSNNPHFEVDGFNVAALASGAAVVVSGDADPVIGLRAIHRGRGKYSIVRGDEDKEVREGLSKADAEAFNSLSEDDKAAYVA